MQNLAAGIAWTSLLGAPLGWGAYLVAREGLRLPRGLPRALGACVLAWAWATLGMLLLGSLGALARAPLAVWSGIGLVVGLAMLRRRRGSPVVAGDSPPGDPGWKWEGLVALGLALWPAAVMGFRSLFLPVKVMSDGPIYHLWFAARWWREERLFLVAAPFGESVVTYFPCGGDLVFSWLMVCSGNEALAKVGQFPFLLLVVLAIYATARLLGAGANPSAVAAAWYATMSPSLVFTSEPNVDTMFVAGYALAVYFLVRHGLGEGGVSSLALGSLAAGLCWGTKPSGLVFVPPLLALAAIQVVRRANTWKQRWRDLTVLAAGPLLMAGWWYVDNLLRSGNPLYPLQIEWRGRPLLTGWHGREVMAQSPYYLPPGDLRALADIVLEVFAPRLLPLWLPALLGLGAVGLGSSKEDRGRARWILALAALAWLNVAIYWLAIPYRTQQRFLFHAAAVATVPLASLLSRARPLQVLGVALLALNVLTPMAWPWAGAGQEARVPWDFSPLIPNALPAPLIVPLSLSEWSEALARARTGGALGFAFLLATWVVGLLSFSLAYWCVGWFRRPARGPATRLVLGIALLLLLGGALAFPWGTGPAARFYPYFPDYYRGWLALERASGSGSSIAYAGTNLPFYLLGPGMKNRVRYVNVNARRDWLMHDYQRLAIARGEPNWPNPRPEWDRLEPDFDAWLANLRAARIRLLVVARHNAGEDWPIERQWADHHPELFRILHGQGEDDPLFRLYRLESGAAR